jgi:hypothetical protein
VAGRRLLADRALIYLDEDAVLARAAAWRVIDGCRVLSITGNLGDVKTVNHVSIIIGNSAGLIVVATGSGVTEQDKLDIAAAVLATLQATTIPVDAQKMNGADVIGDGTEGNPWRGVGVPP